MLRAPHHAGPPTGREATAEAIKSFYEYAVPRIVAVLISSGAALPEASEAAHVALIEAAQSWDSIETSPLSWCITVARRYWGKRKYSADMSFDDIPPSSPLLHDDTQDVGRRVEARLRLTDTVTRLPLLTPRQREVLDLHLAALTTRDIADQLGCQESTVRAHLAAARRTLNSNDDDRDEGEAQ